MIAMLVVLAWQLLLGVPAALLFRVRTLRALFGVAFLLGSGIVAFVLLALPRWSMVNASMTMLVLAAMLWFFALRRGIPAFEKRGWSAFDAFTLLLIVAHARAVTIGPAVSWDFGAIWGLRARVFAAHGGLDWAWMGMPTNAFAHPDYPPLLPLNYVLAAIAHGAWSDRWLGIVTTLFGAATLLIVRDLFARELAPRLAAIATLGVGMIALTSWVGGAEAPMIAFSAAGLLFVRNGDMPLGATLLGLAAFTKNEGLAFLVAVAIALVLSGRLRDALRLWPGVVVALPWIVLRNLHGLSTDVADGAGRVTMASVVGVFHGITTYAPGRSLFWLAIPIALLCAMRDLRRERVVLLAVAIQIVFVLGAYMAMPYDVEWHMRYSWGRVLDQIALPLAFVALVVSGQRADDRHRNREQPDQDQDRDDQRHDHGHERYA